MKILVVDDEKLLVKGVKFNLENEGYEVMTAYDGAFAVELARKGATVILNLSASNELVGKADYRRSLVTGQSARLMY